MFVSIYMHGAISISVVHTHLLVSEAAMYNMHVCMYCIYLLCWCNCIIIQRLCV